MYRLAYPNKHMAIPIASQSLDTRFKRYYHNLEPILKKPRMRATTAAVFSFLAASLFLWYAIRPTAQTIIYLQREIADKTLLNQQMEVKITSLIEAQTTYENIKSNLPLLEQALPHTPNAIILARELRNIANVSQATISALQIPGVPLTTDESTPGAKLTAQKPIEEFTITMVVLGPYQSIKAFLQNLLNLRRITSLDMVSIRQADDLKSPGNTLQLSIRIKSYYSLQ